MYSSKTCLTTGSRIGDPLHCEFAFFLFCFSAIFWYDRLIKTSPIYHFYPQSIGQTIREYPHHFQLRYMHHWEQPVGCDGGLRPCRPPTKFSNSERTMHHMRQISSVDSLSLIQIHPHLRSNLYVSRIKVRVVSVDPILDREMEPMIYRSSSAVILLLYAITPFTRILIP